jgi:hypothetical protein
VKLAGQLVEGDCCHPAEAYLQKAFQFCDALCTAGLQWDKLIWHAVFLLC